ncbi:MAG: transcriptional repressor [Acidobacteria bacterium]|nr:MAG: transcriptional repressor [Acidobacteriota bacterium]
MVPPPNKSGRLLILDRFWNLISLTSVYNDSAGLLRQHGVQVTAQRLAVLAAVSRQPHGTADDIAKAVRADIGVISRQAVYDALAVLAEKGLIRRIQPAGSPARYEDRAGDNHHHLICRACGQMVDVDCAVGAAPCLSPMDDSGYQIDEAEVIYWGSCPECLAQTPDRSATEEETGPAPRALRGRDGSDIQRSKALDPNDQT